MPSMTMSDKDFRAQDDLRTLSESQKIRKDKGRMKAAMAEARKQMDSLSKLGDEA